MCVLPIFRHRAVRGADRLLEFHQLDRMVLAGRQAARALLEALADDTDNAAAWPAAVVQVPAQVQLPDVSEHLSASP